MDYFVSLLKACDIEVLVDVRSYPYSKYAPHFNSTQLKQSRELKAAGIEYLSLGKELGGRPGERDFYDAEGHVLYERVAKSPIFLEGMRRLRDGMRKYRIAIMCGEEDPTGCHRRLLIGQVLAQWGVSPDHIVHMRGDGQLQPEMELRGIEWGSTRPALFDTENTDGWKSTRSVLPRRARTSSSGR
jgi:uncharacterized protein (DUF488 family)